MKKDFIILLSVFSLLPGYAFALNTLICGPEIPSGAAPLVVAGAAAAVFAVRSRFRKSPDKSK